MSKKLLSLVLILVLLMSLCVSSAFADASSSRFEALKAFGVASGDKPSPEKSITRSEFVCMAVRMSGIDSSLYSQYPQGFPFADVRASDEDFPYVRAAYEMGLINGNGGGLFDGKSNIDIQQATKILITLLGHSEKAVIMGGYPYGYISIANEIDLYDGIDMTGASSYLDAKTAYELIMNALESTFVAITSIGEYTRYEATDNMYMSQMLDIFKIEGVAEQNEHTSLYGESEIGEGEIEINGIVFETGETNASEFLGYNVNCYFKENGGSNEIIYIEADEENKTLHLTSRDFNPTSSTLSEISYTENNTERKAKISSDTVLIRNGNMTTLSLKNLCPENGEIILVSNDGDNTYDVAHVFDYRTVVVNVVSATSGSVADALGGESLILDENDSDYTFSIELNGEEIPLTALLKNDVIFYYETNGETPLKKLIVSRKTVSGKIEGITDNRLIVDGKEYYASEAFLSRISLGDMGNFHIDPFGAIASGELTDEISVYGFLNGIKKSGMDGVQVQIFTEKDRWVELEVRSKIKLNGEPADEDDLYAYFMQSPEYRQLISYRVDSNGEITSLSTAVDCSLDAVQAQKALENDEFRLSKEAENAIYRRYLASFTNHFSVSTDAVIFFVPEDGTAKDEFYISGASDLKQNFTYKKVCAYNANETRVTDLLVIYTSGSSVDNSENVSEFMVVDRVSRVMIDGEGVPCVYGTYGTYGETCVYIADDSVVSAAGGLRCGDVLQFGFNSRGLATDISKIYDITMGTQQKELINGSLYSNATIASGIVTSVDTEHMRFTLDYGIDTDALFGLDSYLKVISVYDISDEEIYQIAPADLMKGDRIVVGCRQYQAQSLVVFRD